MHNTRERQLVLIGCCKNLGYSYLLSAKFIENAKHFCITHVLGDGIGSWKWRLGGQSVSRIHLTCRRLASGGPSVCPLRKTKNDVKCSKRKQYVTVAHGVTPCVKGLRDTAWDRERTRLKSVKEGSRRKQAIGLWCPASSVSINIKKSSLLDVLFKPPVLDEGCTSSFPINCLAASSAGSSSESDPMSECSSRCVAKNDVLSSFDSEDITARSIFYSFRSCLPKSQREKAKGPVSFAGHQNDYQTWKTQIRNKYGLFTTRIFDQIWLTCQETGYRDDSSLLGL